MFRRLDGPLMRVMDGLMAMPGILQKVPGYLMDPMGPLAIDWAKRHHAEQAGRWAGTELFEKAIDKIGRYLGQERARRGGGREKTGV